MPVQTDEKDPMKYRKLLIGSTAALAAAALALSAPLAASAHVHVDPDQASPGSYTLLTFRVPTESATAGTVRVEVDFPTATPFTSLSYQPVPGWSAEITTSKLPKPVKISGATVTEAPTKIVWTADSGVQIAPGQFQQFSVSAGVVPDTGSIMMPATQTYSDGSVVKWDQPTPASGNEPEHPAPTLYINDAPPNEATPTIVSSTTAASPAESGASSVDAVALGVGVTGVAIAAIALVVAVFALTRRPGRRPGTAATNDGAATGTRDGSGGGAA